MKINPMNVWKDAFINSTHLIHSYLIRATQWCTSNAYHAEKRKFLSRNRLFASSIQSLNHPFRVHGTIFSSLHNRKLLQIYGTIPKKAYHCTYHRRSKDQAKVSFGRFDFWIRIHRINVDFRIYREDCGISIRYCQSASANAN
jgi:hypothetical protein